MEKSKKRNRRSNKKVITKEAQVLRFMDDAQIMKALNFLKAMIK